MREDFIPAKKQETKAVAPAEEQASVEVARRVTSSAGFVGLIRNAGQYELFVRAMKEIEDRKSYEVVAEWIIAVKRDLKLAEDMRVASVGFPTAYTRMVNGVFKDLKDKLQKIKQQLAYRMDKFAEKDKVRYKEEKEEEEVKWKEEGYTPMEAKVVDGDKIELEPKSEVEAPAAGVTGKKGGKVYRREFWTVEVEDKMKLLKAIVSKDKRLEHITEELVEVRQGVLRDLAIKRRGKTLPGVKAEKEMRTV